MYGTEPETRHDIDRPAAHDPVRSPGRNPCRQRRDRGVRHRGLRVHGRARHLSRGRHPFHPGRARAGRGAHGRRLCAGVRAPRRVHCAERPGHHELRHGNRGGVLGAFSRRLHHARDGFRDDGARWFPGNRAAADLLEDHEIPGPRGQPEAHGGNRRALLRPRDARDGPVPAQHPARLLLRRPPGDDQRTDAHRSRTRRRCSSR